MNKGGIPKRWKELSGQNNWKNLLSPLDIDLRRYIIHYGERAEVTYDNFIFNPLSKYAGSTRYAKKNLFPNVGLDKGNPYKYEVVQYVYATSQLHVPSTFIITSLSREAWSKESNWIGYVAVATDAGKAALGRRDILIAWRGTVQPLEWAEDFNFPLTPASELFGATTNASVHSGFLSIYTSDDPKSPFNKTSARDQVLPVVQQLIKKYKDEELSITVAGHSLGASLATLNAVDMAANKINSPKRRSHPIPITAFVFACPIVGDSHFRDIYRSMNDLHILRIRNEPDVIPRRPPISNFVEVGEELLIDSRKSNYMIYTGTIESQHNLEACYLHGVAGTQGINGGFRLEVKRDIKLINKNSNLLKYEYMVPGYWWFEKNNGMVQKDDGSWDWEGHEDN